MLKSPLNVRLQQLEISEVAAQRASVQRLSRPKSAKHVGFPRSVHGRNQMHQFLKVCPVLPRVAWCCMCMMSRPHLFSGPCLCRWDGNAREALTPRWEFISLLMLIVGMQWHALCCFDLSKSNKFDLFLVTPKYLKTSGHHDMLLKDQGKRL